MGRNGCVHLLTASDLDICCGDRDHLVVAGGARLRETELPQECLSVFGTKKRKM